MTWALKESAPLGGSFLESPATLPRRTSLTDTFLTLNPTLSPGRPSTSCSWCISTDLTSVVTLAGANVTTMPALIIPVSVHHQPVFITSFSDNTHQLFPLAPYQFQRSCRHPGGADGVAYQLVERGGRLRRWPRGGSCR